MQAQGVLDEGGEDSRANVRIWTVGPVQPPNHSNHRENQAFCIDTKLCIQDLGDLK